ncbi:segregation and condensation protein A [endosymbiont of unidentified scaly snail isolate Monju]|nr:segregation and condensation protein A [endosymbiont of unidentified scaly snail isolate Monju]
MNTQTESNEKPAFVGPPQPQQQEMPFAVVAGEPQYTLPKDLYIPPDALEVFLDAFEGPLDLLLYLIRRQNLDILDIPIAEITVQYIQYIEMMHELRFELAAEYLVMAAMLAEIKSRMLLPRVHTEDEEEGEDPRAELIRRLQEYERYKQAAEDIHGLPQVGRDVFTVKVEVPHKQLEQKPPEVDLREVLLALKDVLHRADMFSSHQIQREPLSLRERMSRVLDQVNSEGFTAFTDLFDLAEGRPGVVVTFMAVLELIKQQLIELVQAESFAPIHVKARA